MGTVAIDRGAAAAGGPQAAPAAITIRRVRADDVPLFGAFIMALSPTSRQRRFHIGLRELPREWLQRLTRPDGRHELALLATVAPGGHELCVGEARYVLSDGVAPGREFALAVADGWQGQGLGRSLMRSLGCHAARAGVERLVGEVLRDNLPMLELARSMNYSVKRHPQDARLVLVERSFSALAPPEFDALCAPPPFGPAAASFSLQRR
jgi:GNAT superfamily N-acetyltransferase